jgi:hypothetical protein
MRTEKYLGYINPNSEQKKTTMKTKSISEITKARCEFHIFKNTKNCLEYINPNSTLKIHY